MPVCAVNFISSKFHHAEFKFQFIKHKSAIVIPAEQSPMMFPE
jgi:hypothetical protein